MNKQRMTLQESQQVLRDFVKKNPGKLQKIMTDELGWNHKKLEHVIRSMKSEFYSGLVLKSEVRHG